MEAAMDSLSFSHTVGGRNSCSQSLDHDVEQTDFVLDSQPRKSFDSDGQPCIDTSVPPDTNASSSARTPSVQSSWSTASDRRVGHGSQADPADRVFPIRSVISVDPSSRASESEYFPRMSSDSTGMGFSRPYQSRNDTEVPARYYANSATDSVMSPPAALSSPTDVEIRRRIHTSGARSSVQADADRQGSAPLPLFASEGSDEEDSVLAEELTPSVPDGSSGPETPGRPESALDGLMTTKFRHVLTEEGHHIITGRDGTLQRCEDEPIHTPGSVQGFGVMLAIREEPDGRFTVRYVTENSKRIIGYTPLQLFRLNNFTDILTEEQADNLLDHVDFIRDEDADPAVNGPEVFSMSIRPPKKRYVIYLPDCSSYHYL